MRAGETASAISEPRLRVSLHRLRRVCINIETDDREKQAAKKSACHWTLVALGRVLDLIDDSNAIEAESTVARLGPIRPNVESDLTHTYL